MAEPLLHAAHVTLVYDEASRETARALDDVSLDVFAGERVCVLGANGSGKSTLASVLCGLLAPDEGDVRLLGERVFSDGTADLEAYRRARRGLGLVFQNPEDQIVTSVVADDVAFGPENLGFSREKIGELVARELHRVALDDYADADPRRLSGGQQQRVAIAGALAMEPRAIVFDEPGALLDVRGRRSILHVMDRLRDEGRAVVHVTHFMEEALTADRVVVLDHGHVALAGTPAEVFAAGDALAGLGLEEPFCARLSEKLRTAGLDVPWTCDDAALRQSLVGLAKELDVTKGDVTKGSETFVTPSVTKGSETFVTPSVTEVSDTSATASGPSDASVLVKHASFSYGSARGKALDDVSLTVPQGSAVAIVGQTGSGKSTLLRLICAMDLPDAGTVTVSGLDTAAGGRGHGRKARAWRASLRSRVGYVMQRPERQLFAETVEQDVAFGPSNQGLSSQEVAERVNRALGICGLTQVRAASPFELSGGQQRLCAIAGVLAMRPDTLVLDEPTAGLDPRGRTELRHVLGDLHAHGVTIIQVTHSMEDAAHAERVLVLDQSRVIAEGGPREVFTRAACDDLHRRGLGLPRPLQWAMDLEAAGAAAPGTLGQPLTTQALADALAGVLAHASASPSASGEA